jgi:acyl-CoA reductase-like NAD-dependent aldehyde dehydrogenase
VKNSNGSNTAVEESTKIVDVIARETEQVISKACEAAGQEANQELEKALREYEQKTKQIVIKVMEEARSRTADIANRLSEAIMAQIQQSSTEAVANTVAEFGKRAEKMTQSLQETARQAITGKPSNSKSAEQPEAKKDGDESDESFEIEVGQGKSEGKITGEASQEDSEEFEHWLTQ